MTRRLALALRRSIESSAAEPAMAADAARRIDWPRVLPFVLLHAGCLGVLWSGTSTIAVAFAVALYLVRMFAVTVVGVVWDLRPVPLAMRERHGARVDGRPA